MITDKPPKYPDLEQMDDNGVCCLMIQLLCSIEKYRALPEKTLDRLWELNNEMQRRMNRRSTTLEVARHACRN